MLKKATKADMINGKVMVDYEYIKNVQFSLIVTIIVCFGVAIWMSRLYFRETLLPSDPYYPAHIWGYFVCFSLAANAFVGLSWLNRGIKKTKK